MTPLVWVLVLVGVFAFLFIIGCVVGMFLGMSSTPAPERDRDEHRKAA